MHAGTCESEMNGKHVYLRVFFEVYKGDVCVCSHVYGELEEVYASIKGMSKWTACTWRFMHISVCIHEHM
jgi:hypothetical protein